MKSKIVIIGVVLCMFIATSVFAARTATEYELQQLNRWTGGVTGQGVVTWGNTTPVAVVMTAGASTGTNTWAQTSEVVTLVGGTGIAVAGTQPMINTTVINAGAGTATTGTITWSAGDVLTFEITGPAASAEAMSTDCTGITLTACVTAANAMTVADVGLTVTFAAGTSLPDASYTNLYNPEAAADLAATAFTVGVSSSKVITPIAMADGTLYDSDSLDISGLTLTALETTIEAIYGGSYIAVTIADGLPLDLADSSDSLADKGATDMEASNPLPFTAGTPPLDVLVEDRYTMLAECSYAVDMGTAGNLELYDGSTLIWKKAAVDDASADAWTVVTWDPVVQVTGSSILKFQIQGDDTVTAGSIYCLGRTD